MGSERDGDVAGVPAGHDRPLGALSLHGWADEIRSIANEELHWGNPDEYARRRCDRLIRLAA